MDRSNLTELCWDCHEPLDPATRETFPAHGRLQPAIGGGNVRVCPSCAAARRAKDGEG